MSRRKNAVQAAVNAVNVATAVHNSYGGGSREAEDALTAARQAVHQARDAGATEDDLRAARPQ
jgi:hypothetical protein